MTLLSSRFSMCFVALCLLVSSHQANALLISLQSSSNSVDIGESITLEVWASDLNPDLVAAYDFDLSFDSSVVSYVSASFSNFLGNDDLLSFTSIIDSFESVNVSELSLLSDFELSERQFMGPVGANPNTNFMLASLSFDTLMAGIAEFSLSADGLGQGFISAGLVNLNDVFGQSTVSVEINEAMTPVPSPTGWSLLLAALALVLLLRANAREA